MTAKQLFSDLKTHEFDLAMEGDGESSTPNPKKVVTLKAVKKEPNVDKRRVVSIKEKVKVAYSE